MGVADAGPAIPPAEPVADEQVLDEIARRVLWLATQIIHHANHERPNPDDIKVGGHQASSASLVTILTALYFRFLGAGDRVSIKPHASPVYHAIQYLLGNLDRRYLTTLRDFGGLQAYPSRTKDPDRVDFSTGSVGLGAVAPAFAAVAHRYAQAHFGNVAARRFVAVVGDAELDEGNVWEAVAEEALRALGNVLIVVDLNRQSLDRVTPGIRAAELEALFRAAGWEVYEAKYGRRLQAAFGRPGGAALRRRIDEMSNEEYQSLLRRPAAEARARLTHPRGLAADEDADLALALDAVSDADLPGLVANLGGHDIAELLRVLELADGERAAPAVVFAYTIKGWGLPIAGDPLNHSALLSARQMAALREALGMARGEDWDAFPPDSPAGRLCRATAARLRAGTNSPKALVPAERIPETLGLEYPARISTQETFGRVLPTLADVPGVGERVVTVAPDVAVSTHLSNWINKVGVFSFAEGPDYEADSRQSVTWRPRPLGRHIELGISEMNLFMLLGQLGLADELCDQQFLPIGAVYDPFICRGLDALVYALYSGARFVLVGTPSGVSLSREGGAHQSSVTASLGCELPGLTLYEPAFACEVEWLLLEALRRCADRRQGSATYLRLSTKRLDQELLGPALARLGPAEVRRQALAGGYRLLEGRDMAPGATAAETVQIVTTGAMAGEAAAAAWRLAREGVAANVIHLTSADRLFTAYREACRRRREGATAGWGHIETLLPRAEARAPLVTVHDASAHSLAFLGGFQGARCYPLGVDTFGQSGALEDVYRSVGIGTDDIVAAALLALEEGDFAT